MTRRLGEQPGRGDNAGKGNQSQRFLHNTSLVSAGNPGTRSRFTNYRSFSILLSVYCTGSLRDLCESGFREAQTARGFS